MRWSLGGAAPVECVSDSIMGDSLGTGYDTVFALAHRVIA